MSTAIINNSLNPRGYYNPATNFPILINGVGNAGDFFVATADATRDFGNGKIVIEKNDWVLLSRDLKWRAIKFGRGGGGGGDVGEVTIGQIDSAVKSQDGANVINGDTIIMQTADTNNPGLVSTTAQTFSGSKSFPNGIVANMTGVASGNAIIQGVPRYALLGMGIGNQIVGIPAPADNTQVLFSSGANAYPEFRNISIPDFFPDDIIVAKGMRLSGIDGDARTMIVAGTSVLDNMTANTATITGLVAPTAAITALTAQNAEITTLAVTTTCTVPSELGALVPSTKAVNYESLKEILDGYAPVPPDLSAYAKLLSPMFQGTPTAPTPGLGDNSTRLATTAFAGGILDITNGFAIFPSGLCFQWGLRDVGAGSSSYGTFLVQFTNGLCFLTSINTGSVGVNQPVGGGFTSTAYDGFEVKNPNTSGANIYWCAIGYVDSKRPITDTWKEITVTGSGWTNTIGVPRGCTTSSGRFLYNAGTVSISGANIRYSNPSNASLSTFGEAVVFQSNQGINGTLLSRSYISTNEGQSWQKPTNAPTDGNILTPVINPYNTTAISFVYATNKSYRTTNAWLTKTNITLPFVTLSLFFIGEFNGKYIWWATPYDNSNLLGYSDDDGLTWSTKPLPTSFILTESQYSFLTKSVNGRIFNSGNYVQATPLKQLMFTTDYGNTWELVPQVSGCSIISVIINGAECFIVAGSVGGTLYDTNFNPLGAVDIPVRISQFVQYNSRIYAATYTGPVYVSDNGINFFLTTTPYPRAAVFQTLPQNNMLICGSNYLGGI